MKQILSFSGFYTWAVRLAIVLGLTLSIGSSMYMFVNKDIAPDWDMVWVLYFLLGGLGETAPDWFSSDVFEFRDNEHRPFVPMLIWGIDFEFFDSYGLLPQVLMQLFAILTAVVSTGWSRPRANRKSMTTIAITICACALLLSPMHYENLVWPKQVHVYTSVLFSVLALTIAVSIPSRSPNHQFSLALLCSLLAVGATFSFAYGLVVWPILLLHGLFSRWRWQGYLPILIVSAVTLSAYYSLFLTFPQKNDPSNSMVGIMTMANYAALLLGAPIVGAGFDTILGQFIGYLLLAVVIYVGYKIYLQRRVVDDHQLRSILICQFCVAVAILTSLGRVTINNPLASRYLIIPTLFILAMPGLFQLRPGFQTPSKQLSIVVFLIGTLSLSANAFGSYQDALRSRQFMIREGSIAAAFDTKPIHRGLFPSQDIINGYVWPYYFKHHNHSPPLNILGSLGKLFPPEKPSGDVTKSMQECIGHVENIVNRTGDGEFDFARGWARLGPKGEREAPWVIITNSSGIVAGLATTGIERPELENFLHASWLDNLLTATDRAGFEGLVRSQPGDELNFFAYRDGETCLFEGNVKAPES